MNKHLRSHMEDGKIHQCTSCDLRFYYPEELEQHTIDHYKEDKAKRAEAEAADKSKATVEGKSEQERAQEQENGKEREENGKSVTKNVDNISNNTLSPSVFLQPAFVHDNLQLWN